MTGVQTCALPIYVKMATVRFNAFAGPHRVVASVDVRTQKVKYLLTNQRSWNATKIVSLYSERWVIEEFFRNAKQLFDMDGVMLRSEQGISVSLCLVFWLDYLLHMENYKLSISGEFSKEPVTIPSIIRQAQYENMEAFIERIQSDEEFVYRWCEVERKNIFRNRKKRKELIMIEDAESTALDLAA